MESFKRVLNLELSLGRALGTAVLLFFANHEAPDRVSQEKDYGEGWKVRPSSRENKETNELQTFQSGGKGKVIYFWKTTYQCTRIKGYKPREA